jgi:hypothetical protein
LEVGLIPSYTARSQLLAASSQICLI